MAHRNLSTFVLLSTVFLALPGCDALTERRDPGAAAGEPSVGAVEPGDTVDPGDTAEPSDTAGSGDPTQPGDSTEPPGDDPTGSDPAAPPPDACAVVSIERAGVAEGYLSPDGRHYVRNSRDAAGTYQVYVGDTRSAAPPRCISCSPPPGAPAPGAHKLMVSWHPSGDWLFVGGEIPHDAPPFVSAEQDLGILQCGPNLDMYVTTPDGDAWYKLVEFGPDKPAGGYTGPAVAPDGRAYWAEITDGNIFAYSFGKWRLMQADFVVDANGVPSMQNPVDISPPDTNWIEPGTVSADGKYLLLTLDTGLAPTLAGGMDQWTLDLQTGEYRNLNATPAEWDEHGIFAPNGREIVFMSSRPFPAYDARTAPFSIVGVLTEFMLTDVSGREPVQLTHFNTPGYPEYTEETSLAAVAFFTPDGSQLVAAQLLSGAGFPNQVAWTITFAGSCGGDGEAAAAPLCFGCGADADSCVDARCECGATGGACAAGAVCSGGACCEPNCAGKCGGDADGCGGVCPGCAVEPVSTTFKRDLAGTCSSAEDYPVEGYAPAGGGRHPLLIYTVGTWDDFHSAINLQILEEAASRGFVAVSPNYNNDWTWAGCPDVVSRAHCNYDPTEPESVVAKMCAHPAVDCGLGIVTAGHSQGAQLAAYAKNFDDRVQAAWGLGASCDTPFDLGAGDNLAMCNPQDPAQSCLLDASTALPGDRLRIVNGESEWFGAQGEYERMTGLRCAEGARECLAPGGGGWYVIPDSAVQDEDADHFYFVYGSELDGGFAPPSTTPWSLDANLDWLRSFVAAPATP